MKDLTVPVSTAAAASMAGWVEIVDLYPRQSIDGVTVYRLAENYPGGIEFFAPQFDPEPIATRGTAATYANWPMKRGRVPSSGQSTNDRVQLALSNVSGEMATRLNAIDWRGSAVVIRRVPTTAGTITADDCVTVFSGRVDTVSVTLQIVQFTCSSDLGNFQALIPQDAYHAHCRFAWGDDYCGQLRYAAANYKTGTIATGSSRVVVASEDFTEDTGSETSYGTDLINALSNGAITTSSEIHAREGYRVRSAYSTDYWAADVFGSPSSWGDVDQGYWLIKSAEAGLANPALSPWIQLDLGSAKTPKIWRLQGLQGQGREVLPRLCVFFSSADGTTWTHETYGECGPEQDKTFDILIPTARSRRYWRICLRTRWTASVLAPVFAQVEAYVEGRDYWRDGFITFDASTSTTALQGVRRRISASYAGQIMVDRPLPAIPGTEDTFVVERGCGLGFNDCCARQNWLQFGGMPQGLGGELVADAGGVGQSAAGGGGGSGGGSGGGRQEQSVQ